MTPGTAGGTERRSARTVAAAASATGTLGASLPGSTMLGFSSVPSSNTWWSDSA